MKKEENIDKIYLSEESINTIVNKIKHLYFNDLKKTSHYKYSLLRRNTDEDLLKECFVQFDKIKMVLYRTRTSGYNSYDFIYVIDKTKYITYSIHFDKKPYQILNAIVSNRIFDNYREYLTKTYPEKLI